MPELLIDKIARLEGDIAAAEAQRSVVALGHAVVDAWRDGRRVRYQVATLAQLEDYIRILRSELTAAQIENGQTPARTRGAIPLVWKN